MNDFRPGQGRLQQESILAGLLTQSAAKTGKTCPECGERTDINKLKAHPNCTGQTCRACGWESPTPQYKLMPNGQVVPVGGFVAGDVH